MFYRHTQRKNCTQENGDTTANSNYGSSEQDLPMESLWELLLNTCTLTLTHGNGVYSMAAWIKTLRTVFFRKRMYEWNFQARSALFSRHIYSFQWFEFWCLLACLVRLVGQLSWCFLSYRTNICSKPVLILVNHPISNESCSLPAMNEWMICCGERCWIAKPFHLFRSASKIISQWCFWWNHEFCVFSFVFFWILILGHRIDRSIVPSGNEPKYCDQIIK